MWWWYCCCVRMICRRLFRDLSSRDVNLCPSWCLRPDHEILNGCGSSDHGEEGEIQIEDGLPDGAGGWRREKDDV